MKKETSKIILKILFPIFLFESLGGAFFSAPPRRVLAQGVMPYRIMQENQNIENQSQALNTLLLLSNTPPKELVDITRQALKDEFQGDPWLDSNNNGKFDPGTDTYADLDHNGTYTPPKVDIGQNLNQLFNNQNISNLLPGLVQGVLSNAENQLANNIKQKLSSTISSDMSRLFQQQASENIASSVEAWYKQNFSNATSCTGTADQIIAKVNALLKAKLSIFLSPELRALLTQKTKDHFAGGILNRTGLQALGTTTANLISGDFYNLIQTGINVVAPQLGTLFSSKIISHLPADWRSTLGQIAYYFKGNNFYDLVTSTIDQLVASTTDAISKQVKQYVKNWLGTSTPWFLFGNLIDDITGYLTNYINTNFVNPFLYYIFQQTGYFSPESVKFRNTVNKDLNWTFYDAFYNVAGWVSTGTQAFLDKKVEDIIYDTLVSNTGTTTYANLFKNLLNKPIFDNLPGWLQSFFGQSLLSYLSNVKTSDFPDGFKPDPVILANINNFASSVQALFNTKLSDLVTNVVIANLPQEMQDTLKTLIETAQLSIWSLLPQNLKNFVTAKIYDGLMQPALCIATSPTICDILNLRHNFEYLFAQNQPELYKYLSDDHSHPILSFLSPDAQTFIKNTLADHLVSWGLVSNKNLFNYSFLQLVAGPWAPFLEANLPDKNENLVFLTKKISDILNILNSQDLNDAWQKLDTYLNKTPLSILGDNAKAILTSVVSSSDSRYPGKTYQETANKLWTDWLNSGQALIDDVCKIGLRKINSQSQANQNAIIHLQDFCYWPFSNAKAITNTLADRITTQYAPKEISKFWDESIKSVISLEFPTAAGWFNSSLLDLLKNRYSAMPQNAKGTLFQLLEVAASSTGIITTQNIATLITTPLVDWLPDETYTVFGVDINPRFVMNIVIKFIQKYTTDQRPEALNWILEATNTPLQIFEKYYPAAYNTIFTTNKVLTTPIFDQIASSVEITINTPTPQNPNKTTTTTAKKLLNKSFWDFLSPKQQATISANFINRKALPCWVTSSPYKCLFSGEDRNFLETKFKTFLGATRKTAKQLLSSSTDQSLVDIFCDQPRQQCHNKLKVATTTCDKISKFCKDFAEKSFYHNFPALNTSILGLANKAASSTLGVKVDFANDSFLTLFKKVFPPFKAIVETPYFDFLPTSTQNVLNSTIEDYLPFVSILKTPFYKLLPCILPTQSQALNTTLGDIINAGTKGTSANDTLNKFWASTTGDIIKKYYQVMLNGVFEDVGKTNIKEMGTGVFDAVIQSVSGKLASSVASNTQVKTALKDAFTNSWGQIQGIIASSTSKAVTRGIRENNLKIVGSTGYKNVSSSCLSNDECISNECISTNPLIPSQKICGKGKLGVPCLSNDGCLSGFCVEGICCNNSCQVPGYACNIPNREGYCYPKTNP